jgi:hypothetical protein
MRSLTLALDALEIGALPFDLGLLSFQLLQQVLA